jgi:hypothetical protein
MAGNKDARHFLSISKSSEEEIPADREGKFPHAFWSARAQGEKVHLALQICFAASFIRPGSKIKTPRSWTEYAHGVERAAFNEAFQRPLV